MSEPLDNLSLVSIDLPLLSDSSKKMIGVEFDGVMCSTTKEDQDALVAIYFAYQLQGNNFQPTVYQFKNGNDLTITKDNIVRFAAAWLPARQSFFTPQESS